MPAKKEKKEKKPTKPEVVEDDDARSGSEAEVEEEEKPTAPAKKANLFALMADSDDEEEEEEVEPDFGDKKKKKKAKAAGDDELSAMFGEKKKKKKEGDKKDEKKKDGDSKDEEKKDGEKKKKKEKKPMPIVCQVKEVMPVPKKDKLRVCKVCIAEGSPFVDVVTNAANVEAGKKFIVALPGVTTANGVEVKQAKVGGVESSGMFCGPQELGWETDVFDEKMAVMLSESAEVGAPAPSYDEAVQMLRDREKVAAAEKEEAEAKGKKGKKKGAAKADEEDLDAVFAEFGLDAKEIAEAAAAKGKKGKKGKAAKPEDDGDAGKDDPKEESAKPEAQKEEEAPAELEKEEALDPKAAAKGKKKDKKKGNKAGANQDDDDFDAVLGELKETAPPATAAEPPTSEAQEEENDNAGGAEDESTMDAKALANKRKKEKKKAKKGATGGEGMWGGAEDGEEVAAASAGGAVPSSSKAAPEDEEVKPDPKKGAKKESATVKAARERMEMQKKLEEEKRIFEEEQRRLIEEEERKIREEEERIEAEKLRKREARLAKIRKAKEDGTFQTKKEKERARRAAQLREMFGFDIEDNEDDKDEAEGEAQKEAPAKLKVNKQSFAKKKKGGKKVDDEEEDGKAVAEEMKEPEPAQEEVQKAPVEAKAKEEDADGDDWEQVAETLETNEEEPDAKEAADVKESKVKDEETDEESGSEKSSDDGNDSDSSGSCSDFPGYRSPIIVIMGHVDTGKTKLLDKIRRTNVQEGEAGGITQQIGATFFPDIALLEQTKKVDPDFDLEVPGIMIIDTPGHESFNNLRLRGSSLCDMAIVVIDIMHGLEPQTVESLEMLKKRRCPFIIALNKIDVCYQWSSKSYTGIREALDRQEQFVRDEFQQRLGNVKLQLNERGLNVALYWENEDPRSCVSIVPTSALTGEGVPDLLYQLLNLSQTLMSSQLEVKEELQCTVIEVKNIEGLGTTIDVILLNGTLKEGDQIVLAGLGGPIVTTIRALLTPQPMKEMRVKNEYVNHKKISTSMGVKICAPGLEDAVAGTELLVVGPDDDIEELKEEVSEGFDSILSEFQKEPEGVYVKASTLGSLEALITFLRDMKIPVFDVGIGEVHKKDVKKASIMKEKKRPEFAVILCFDVKVNHEANLQAAHDGVQIFTADIIYHLFDKFKSYMEKIHESKKTETRAQAVFPVILQIDKQYVFNKRDPFIFGCSVVGGQLRMQTPICVPEKDNLCIGHVSGIEKDHKPIQVARRGDTVCVKIEQNTAQKNIAYGRHFDHTNQLFSLITRESIDTLKENFKEEMQKSDWEMVIAMKKVFQIQ